MEEKYILHYFKKNVEDRIWRENIRVGNVIVQL